tara:strand:+ start:952 stop:1239 length:288 start_codon:yes stop_codon:yes gene_type:complete
MGSVRRKSVNLVVIVVYCMITRVAVITRIIICNIGKNWPKYEEHSVFSGRAFQEFDKMYLILSEENKINKTSALLNINRRLNYSTTQSTPYIAKT